MRIRDGPAAVRGDAPPSRSHWRHDAGKATREGASSQKTCRALHNPELLEEGRLQVLRSFVLLAGAALAALVVAVAGAAGAGPTPGSFPVTVVASNGKVTVKTRPSRIVSLSPTATETLFAIGAGPQVVAVDDQSDYPKSRAADVALRLHAERRGDRRLQAGSRRHRLRPEGSLGRARPARASPCCTRTARRASRARTSRSASSGW